MFESTSVEDIQFFMRQKHILKMIDKNLINDKYSIFLKDLEFYIVVNFTMI